MSIMVLPTTTIVGFFFQDHETPFRQRIEVLDGTILEAVSYLQSFLVGRALICPRRQFQM